MRHHPLLLVSLLAALPLTVAAEEESRPSFEGDGKVLAVDVAKATVDLDHGPIPGLMPPMRMRFTVAQRDQLRAIKVGDEVRFSLGSRGDEMVIVTIDRVARPAPTGRSVTSPPCSDLQRTGSGCTP
jgi:Cu/Ag efflux protein CusF